MKNKKLTKTKLQSLKFSNFIIALDELKNIYGGDKDSGTAPPSLILSNEAIISSDDKGSETPPDLMLLLIHTFFFEGKSSD